MKKISNNNKFRGNAVYSLNYKFDSVSPAGKCSGTALDLIKRYNELAKEAQNNGDYVGMEVFRQYAEHYRKIVTEINERKYQARDNQNNNNNAEAESNAEENNTTAAPADNGLVETQAADNTESENATPATAGASASAAPKPRRTRAFTVIDASNSSKPAEAQQQAKPHKRTYTRKPKAAAETAEA